MLSSKVANRNQLLERISAAKFSSAKPRSTSAKKPITKVASPLKIRYEKEESPEEEEKKHHVPFKKAKAKAAATTKATAGDIATAKGDAPTNWEVIWDGIEKMRKVHKGAVDTMGCDVEHLEKASKEDKAYHTLVSLMLSA